MLVSISVLATTRVESLSGPAACARAPSRLIRFACPLPLGCRIEQFQARADVQRLRSQPRVSRHDANDLASLLETDVVTGPDPVLVRECLGYGDLELAGYLAHVLTLV